MAHKLTQLAHPARKKIYTLLQHHQQSVLGTRTRRLAYADGVIAISGKDGINFARAAYGVDLNDGELQQRFESMIINHGYEQALDRTADKCAEAHLWMTLVGRSASYHRDGDRPRHFAAHPRQLHVWTFEFDRKMRLSEDSPCGNCRQWLRSEFCSANGT